MLDAIFSGAFLWQTLRVTVPYALPAVGATFSERGGVVNVALEGMMLAGAFATATATYLTGSPLLGIIAGTCAGMLVALVHAAVCVFFRADQIVSGIALNLLALGLTKFLCQLLFDSSSNSARIVGIEQWPLFRALPSGLNPFIILTVIIVVLANILLFRTPFGLRLRAAGENPKAVDSLGVRVAPLRIAGVVISGALAGLGGAWLAMDQHSYTDGMTAGRGFIALAAMIVGKWKPNGAVGACLLFGLAESFTIQFQALPVPTQLIQLIPYLLTMVVLAGFIGRSTPPAADGIPYERTE